MPQATKKKIELSTRATQALAKASPKVQRILERSLSGPEISECQGQLLFEAEDHYKPTIYHIANYLRWQVNSDHVSFVVNRNINFTNICCMGCRFCDVAKRADQVGAESLDLGEIVARATEAWHRVSSKVCIQGGLHPKLKATFYRDCVIALKTKLPDLHIHAFSSFEIWYGASKDKIFYIDFLRDLKACGLGSIPGTEAEIVDTKIRKQLTKNKLSAEKWVEIIKAAHSVELPGSETIMYGHIDGPKHWAAHLALICEIQKKTGGFTEFLPLSFVHSDSPLFMPNPERVRSGATTVEINKMHEVSRIMLSGWIDNIQVSWTKLGPERARELLGYGANDLGGMLMNESISRAAGSNYGQEITAKELVSLIRSIGRIPVLRNTVYKTVDIFKDHDPVEIAPLVWRKGKYPFAFIDMFPDKKNGKSYDQYA